MARVWGDSARSGSDTEWQIPAKNLRGTHKFAVSHLHLLPLMHATDYYKATRKWKCFIIPSPNMHTQTQRTKGARGTSERVRQRTKLNKLRQIQKLLEQRDHDYSGINSSTSTSAKILDKLLIIMKIFSHENFRRKWKRIPTQPMLFKI